MRLMRMNSLAQKRLRFANTVMGWKKHKLLISLIVPMFVTIALLLPPGNAQAVSPEQATTIQAQKLRIQSTQFQVEGAQLQLEGKLQAAIQKYKQSTALRSNPKLEKLIGRLEQHLTQKKWTTAPAVESATGSSIAARKSRQAHIAATVQTPQQPLQQVVGVEIPERVHWKPPVKPENLGSWPKGDVLWQQVSKLDKRSDIAKPIDIPLHLEFEKMSSLAYAAALTTAKEALRLVYGMMTPEQTNQFEEKWAPYYDYPAREIVDYLNQLNPLLIRFLQARAGYTSAAKGAYLALSEAGLADGYQDTHGLTTAMAQVHFQQVLMTAYQDTMRQTVEDILALGPMPNPLAIRLAHRKRFQEAIDVARGLGVQPQQVAAGKYYVLTKIETYPSQKQSTKNDTYVFHFTEGLAQGSFHHVEENSGFIPAESSATVTWDPFPRLIPSTGSFKTKIKASVSLDTLQWQSGMTEDRKTMFTGWDLVTPRFRIGESREGGLSPFPGGTLDVNRNIRKKSAMLDPHYGNYIGDNPPQVTVDTLAATPGGRVFFRYTYKRKELSAEQATAIKVKTFDDFQQHKKSVIRVKKAFAKKLDEAKIRAANLHYQQETAFYFKARKQQVEQALQQAADPNTRKQLGWQLLAYDADMHAAQDSQTYLETGQWIRTRTLFDDYNATRMEALGKETAKKAMATQKGAASALRNIEMLPPSLQPAAKAIFQQAYLADIDRAEHSNTIKAANKKIGSMLRDYWQKQAISEAQKARNYHYLLRTAQAVEIGAGIATIGLGGAAVAGAGGSAVMVWAADSLLGASYGGATGYAKGGTEAALQHSLEWAGTLGFTLSQGIEGYRQTGEYSGMAKRAATAFLFAKGLEFGVNYLRGFGHIPVDTPNLHVEEFSQGLEHGRQLVQNLERTEWELAQALNSGGSQETIDQLTREASDLAADINASWPAKYFLKQTGPSIAGSAFTHRIEQTYARMMPGFRERLARMGYDTTNLAFSPLRNASSSGTVSMDLDLALHETPGMVIRRHGRPVSLATFQEEAQMALNGAYEAATGRSARHSFLNLTTTKHTEAFYNRLLLSGGENVPWEQMTHYDISQAGDVARTKMREAAEQLTNMARLVEQSRAVEKEMRNRFLPHLQQKITAARQSGNTKLAKKLQQSHEYWQTLYNYYLRIGKTERDPATIWRLTREVENFTGGHSPSEIVDIMATFWEGLTKFT